MNVKVSFQVGDSKCTLTLDGPLAEKLSQMAKNGDEALDKLSSLIEMVNHYRLTHRSNLPSVGIRGWTTVAHTKEAFELEEETIETLKLQAAEMWVEESGLTTRR